MALKENYKDDILDVSVNTKRKYRMTENPDGTISLEDETVYTQEGDSFGSGDINATNGKVNTLDSAVTTLNANLDGFKFYPSGTDIVGLISDDSAYTDANGKYVIWGTATANQLVADNPNTYKSVPSTEDLRGEVGADTGIPFSKIEMIAFFHKTLMDGLVHNVTLKAESTYAVICYPYSRRDSSYSGGTPPTISGNYTLVDQNALTTNGWFYLYCNVQIIKKNKGDDNVIVTFPRSTEKNGGFGFVIEF